MGKADEVPESIPEMDTLGDSENEQIESIFKKVYEQNGEKWPYLFEREENDEARKLLAYKFLKARKWNEEDALRMIEETIKFREENKLDEWRLFPSAFPLLGYDQDKLIKTLSPIIPGEALKERRDQNSSWDLCYRALQTSYVNVYHYWDKAGHPIIYDCFGQANVGHILKDLNKIIPPGKDLKDVIVPYHTYMNEVQYYMIRYADYLSKAENKRAIMGATVVMNTEGIHTGMIQRRFLHVVKCIFEVDQKYYPEVLHRLFVINCPKLVQMAYNLVKGSLDVNTRKKVLFVPKNESLAVLEKVIDKDKIPKELGGGCNCEGGCLPCYVAKDGALDSEDLTEEVTIKAGKLLKRKFDLAVGQSVAWDFTCVAHDCLFKVIYQTKDTILQSTIDTCMQQAVDMSVEALSTSTEKASNAEKAQSPKEVIHVDPNADKLTDKSDSKSKKSTKDKDKEKKREKESTKAKEKDSKKDKKLKDIPNSVVIRNETSDCDSDTFVCPQEGTLTLIWDNHSSWMTEKKLKLRVKQE